MFVRQWIEAIETVHLGNRIFSDHNSFQNVMWNETRFTCKTNLSLIHFCVVSYLVNWIVPNVTWICEKRKNDILTQTQPGEPSYF